ncbi:hypothetical protein V491_07595 [Pseudogymnoascus sp. VKM F-3775]|nr:hypothetical protein V491_07595 [Pseudogymnoascus sp. VKM F-3775]
MTSNFVHHLQPNSAELPIANSTALFSHTSIGTPAPTITQPDHLGPIARPTTELGPPRLKRRLEYDKCDFCRQSKKKCQPSKRQWPGEKCQRCKARGLECSAPTKKTEGGSDVLIVDNNSLLTSSQQDLLHNDRAYCSLAEKSIQQMCSSLTRNICKLTTTNAEIDTIDRSDIINVLPDELQYSCRFWILHLYRGKNRFLVDVDLQNQVYDFLAGYFLCWLEALSLLRLVHDGINSLESLERLLNNMQSKSTEKLRGVVQDAKRFVLNNTTEIERFPLHIHYYAPRFPRSISMKGDDILRLPARGDSHCGEVWGTLTTTLEGHPTFVRHIAFSPCAMGKALRVPVCDDNVGAIAFLPDGNVPACAINNNKTGDWMLKLFGPDYRTEAPKLNPIRGTGFVGSIKFSPDGKLLASISDETVRLWDSSTGALMQILSDYETMSIAFSPDGRPLASAFVDCVKVWDPHTGSEIRTFVADCGDSCADTITFSPDSQLLACFLYDNSTVTILDPLTGIQRQTLVGHNNNISSIAFSSDGKLLATASFSRTVELWDPTTGRRKGTLGGRKGSTTPIAFSPDGSLLAWVAAPRLSDKWAVDLWELHNCEFSETDANSESRIKKSDRLYN